MAGRGRGRGGQRLTLEQFGLSKEDAQSDEVVPPPLFPARTPCPQPAPITENIKYMLDIGASIKEVVKNRVVSGNVSMHLGVPLELLVAGEDFKSLSQSKSKKKKKNNNIPALNILNNLKSLEETEEQNDKSDKDEESEASDSNAEKVSDDSSEDENSDRSMDENLDYYKNYEDDDNDEPMSEEENYEAAV